MGPQISFAPLAALPLLRILDVWWPWSGWQAEFSDAQVDQLRALPRLQQLRMPMTTPLLRRLLRQPHTLQWQQISLPDALDVETAALLPQLPSLTAISGTAWCGDFGWLRRLPNLTDVSLAFGPANAAGHVDSLLAGLQSCAAIEILALDNFSHLTAAHLADLLPRLPRLRQLNLSRLDIGSLAFLAQPPMTSQLISLELRDCVFLPVAELRHVHSLRGLTALDSVRTFHLSLGDRSRSQLTLPSALLLLEKFRDEERSR